MSISTNSINYGDDFTPAENGEVNGGAINLKNDGQFDGKNSESIADQQQLKELREKFAKMEMELKIAKLELENVKKIAKLELENKVLEQKLKNQELMVEQKALKEKVDKIEQKMEKNATAGQLSKILEKISELEKEQRQQNENTTKDAADQFSKIPEKINELETQQKEQNENTTKSTSDQFSEMQNDQMGLLEKFSEIEKGQKPIKALLNLRQNYWDANACHKKLEIIGDKNLTVHHKGKNGWCSVFAEYSILMNKNSPNIFYYEISVKNKIGWFISFGFGVKQQNKLNGRIRHEYGTYSYDSFGDFCINGKGKETNGEYSYGVGDTVGIGVNSATRQIIFTKNGLRLGYSNFFVAPSSADRSFHPFVSMYSFGDKIEANFGPNFKFVWHLT
ncbi:hypothetical protein niasHS_005029 [Heterodera schachtii]|uniref:B30.2/SPRY domain-containing protein n=1 Tax=Heterodera schachtii TaxID=97005 RepID=A0ABD2JKE0_HETSC